MSKTLQQIFATNPITSNISTDLMYFVQSPYTPGTDAGMTFANFSNQFVLSTAVISPAHGGTGINNGTSTITIGGNLSFSGAFTTAFTVTATTTLTLPTSGTLATTSQLLSSPLTTKGDIWVWTTTNARLPVATGDGKILQVSSGAASGLAYSTPTYPSASGTSGTFLISDGTNVGYSTSTIPTSAGATANKLLISNGTNYALSTPTFPASASATTRKIIVSDGTNWVASTETYAVPGTSGNVLTSDGTNWTSAAPAVTTVLTTKGDILGFSTVDARIPVGTTNGQILQVNSANAVGVGYSTPTYPSASGASGAALISNGTNYVASTSLWPNTVGTSGKVVISNGTSNVYSTPTFPNASATLNKVIQSDGTNWIASTSTITLGGNFTTSGAFTTTLTVTGTTNVTLPTSGTLLTSASPAITTPSITTGINDVNGNTMLAFSPTGSAVNAFTFTNTAGTASPSIAATGTATNLILTLKGKGTGGVTLTGTTAADNAASGYVGEVISSNIAVASAVSCSNGTPRNITSISLTAGDWDVFGNVIVINSGVNTGSVGWVSTTSATQPDNSQTSQYGVAGSGVSGYVGAPVPYQRINISSTTTVYLSVNAIFSTGSTTACGSIYARRVR